jgi:EAL domain-containing protein (putative c-di-GMP-specific phosphodiesterase class I)
MIAVPPSVPFNAALDQKDSLHLSPQQSMSFPHTSLHPVLKDTPFSLDFIACNWQPQVSFSDGRITGFELLIRGQKDGHVIPGDQCIAWAASQEKQDVVNQWVIQQALSHIPLVPEDTMISLNICAQDLSMDIAQFLIHEVERQHISPHRLCLEITEHLPPKSFTDLIKISRMLRRHGIKMAIDDFGTGHATLNYLVALELDFIKIDKSYIRDISLFPVKQKILGHLLDLVEITEATVIVEGIETKDDESILLNLLRHRRPAWGQGYLYGKPGALNSFSLHKNTDNVLPFAKVAR